MQFAVVAVQAIGKAGCRIAMLVHHDKELLKVIVVTACHGNRTESR